MSGAIDIKNGPSKYDLFAALGDRHLGRHVKLTVDFLIHGRLPEDILVLVDSIAIEDGSGESWNVAFSRLHGLPNIEPRARESFSGYYSTKTRTGALVR